MSEATQWFYKCKEILKPIIETQMIGLARGLIGLPIDHLFDRFKTLVQSSLNNNFRQLVIESYTTNGLFKGVFAGFSAQSGIQMFKQYYRWPMMIFIPKIYLEHMPQKVKEMAPALHKGLTGVTIALFESVITCPMERIKCQLMTQKISKSGISLCNQVIKTMWINDGSLVALARDLFTGMEIMVIKQVVSWTNYLYWDHRVRYYFKEKPSSKLSYSEIAMCAVMSAIPNILIVQPFDTVKTQYQMENNQNIKDLSIWRAFKKVYSMNGLIGLYAGWQMKMCQFTFSALLTTPVMDYLERQHGIPVV